MTLATALLLLPVRDGPRPDALAVPRGSEPRPQREQAVGGDSSTPGKLDVGRVETALKEGSFAAAESLAVVLLAGVQTPSDSARVLDLLTTALWRGGKARDPRSRELALQAIAIKQRELGPQDPGVATSLRNLGILYEEAGEYTRAKALYDSVLSIRQKSLGPDRAEVAESWTDLGIVYRITGDYARARDCVEHALAIGERALGPEDPELGWTWNLLGNVLMSSGDYLGSRAAFERAVALREHRGKDHPEVAGALNNLGALLMEMGDLVSARAAFERALRIRESKLGPEHPHVATTLADLAICANKEGAYDEARKYLERALTIQEKSMGEDSAPVAMTFDGYAEALQRLGDARAPQFFERAVSILERALGPDHVEVSDVLQHWAGYEREKGDLIAARRHVERAVAIRSDVLGPDHPDVGQSLGLLAEVEARAGRPAAAMSAALRAESIGREHLRLTMRALAERPALRYASARPSGLDVALSLVAAGCDETARRRVWDALVRSRALVLDEMVARHRLTTATRDTQVVRLVEALGAARARLANLVVRGHEGMSQDAYRTLLDGARSDKERAERDLAEKSTAFRSELARGETGLTAVAARLPRRSTLVAYVLYGRTEVPGTAAQSSSRLPVDRAPESGVQSGPIPSYMAFVFRPGARGTTAISLGPAAEIERSFAAWRRLVVNADALPPDRAEEAYVRGGAELRRLVWDPIAAAAAGAERVFVVPDGVLQLLNFSTLPSPAAGEYLVETAPPIHYVSAERDLAVAPAQRRGRGLFIAGGADFDLNDEVAALGRGGVPRSASDRGRDFRGVVANCVDFESVRFRPLPASIPETEHIVQLWRRFAAGERSARSEIVQRVGAEATEAAFDAGAPGKRVVHVATHGFFLDGDCLEVESKGRGIGTISRPGAPAAGPMSTVRPGSAAGENPLLLAGLAFAGANQRARATPGAEDGILTAEEIASLDLRDVDWVVLSACDTGVGEVRGREGVFGLRRAFQTAGAGTLIMSLWAVQDDAARRWMQALYEGRLERHLGTAAAVQRATLHELRARREKHESTLPCSWGGFVAVGAWR